MGFQENTGCPTHCAHIDQQHHPPIRGTTKGGFNLQYISHSRLLERSCADSADKVAHFNGIPSRHSSSLG